MNNTAKIALERSIKEKWEPILAGESEDRGSGNCPLCIEFLKLSELNNEPCVRCPVFEKTGKKSCIGTPYGDWTAHHEKEHWEDETNSTYAIQADCSRCYELAEEETDFLKSLREV